MALNEILRMHEDLDKALGKPIAKRSWGMVIDLRKCVGCHACTVSCSAENVPPPGTSYRNVLETEQGSFPTLNRFFMPTNCQQCENAPCMKAANKIAKGAITKRKDGIIEFHYGLLAKSPKAREAAKKACPYTAIVEDKGGHYTDGTPVQEPYELRDFFENGQKLTRKRDELKGTIRKCTFCNHRLENEMLPACVSTCVGRAMYFGDLNDSGSLVSELLRKETGFQVLANQGTKPRVHYLGYQDRTTISATTAATCLECHEGK